jgi:hypothetical protein
MAAQMVLVAAAMAATGQFATGHGYEGTLTPFDDLQITHDKTTVKRD